MIVLIRIRVVLTKSHAAVGRVLAGVVDGHPVRVFDEMSERFWWIGRTSERRWCVVELVPPAAAGSEPLTR